MTPNSFKMDISQLTLTQRTRLMEKVLTAAAYKTAMKYYYHRENDYFIYVNDASKIPRFGYSSAVFLRSELEEVKIFTEDGLLHFAPEYF